MCDMTHSCVLGLIHTFDIIVGKNRVLQCVAVCCSVLQFVAVCCSLLQSVAVCCRVQTFYDWHDTLQARGESFRDVSCGERLLLRFHMCDFTHLRVQIDSTCATWLIYMCHGSQVLGELFKDVACGERHLLLIGNQVLQCVAVCCSVLQCVAVCCSVLQCVAMCCNVVQCGIVWCSVVQRAAV